MPLLTTFAGSATVAAPPSSLLTALQHYYGCDEGGTGSFVDSVVAANLTDINTCTSGTAKLGSGSRQFTSANAECASRASQASYAFGDTGCVDWTVAGWVLCDSAINFQFIITKGTELQIRREGAGDLWRLLANDTSGVQLGIGIGLATWAFFCGRYNSATGKAIFTIDATSSAATTIDAITPGSGALNLGGRAGSGNHNGRLDGWGIWTSAVGAGGYLTDTQVTNLYNGGTGADYPFTGVA